MFYTQYIIQLTFPNSTGHKNADIFTRLITSAIIEINEVVPNN